MTDYLKHDEVLIKVSDNHEDLFIRGYVAIQVLYKLPLEAMDNPEDVSRYTNPVIEAAQKAAREAAKRFRPDDIPPQPGGLE